MISVGGGIKYKEDYDEDGCVIPNRYIVDYKESHWSTFFLDSKYLDWKSTSTPNLVREQMFSEDVYLVKGNGIEDNPYLSETCKETIREWVDEVVVRDCK